MRFNMSILGLFAVCFVVLIQECISTDCGDLFNGTSGTITSPTFVSKTEQCELLIRVAEGRRVTLFFHDIDLDEDTDCGYSYVKVYDGISKFIGKFCFQDNLRPLVSSSNTMGIVFHFDSESVPPSRGFNATYYSTVIGCGGELKEEKGSFASPRFPDNYYAETEECTWTISAPIGRTITLVFNYFNFPGTRRSCRQSGVEVYDGNSEREVCHGTYSQNHPHFKIISTERSMTIKLHKGYTDRFHATYYHTVVQCPAVSKPENGFVKYRPGRNVNDTLVYSCETGYALQGLNTRHCQSDGEWTAVAVDPTCQRCGGNLTLPTDVIMSPNYPNGYPTNTRCKWTINANESNRITLLFIKLDLEETDKCAHDYVTVYDAPNNFSMPMGLFCGRTIPSTIESSSNSMTIVFQSGSHTQETGFMVVYYIKMAEDNPITGAGALHSEGENKIPYFVIIFGILLGITVLLIIGLVAYITFVHRRKHEDPMEMYDNPVYDSTSDVTSLTPSGRTSGMDRNRSARSTETDTPEEMEIVDNLYYGSFEASGGDHGQGRANKSASKIGPITGDIYAEVQKDKPGQIYANQ